MAADGDFLRIWRYTVPLEHTEEFDREYGGDGAWAQLFRQSDGFLGTTLFRQVGASTGPAVYLTIDRFASRAAWLAFRDRHSDDYGQVGRRLAHLTLEQEELL